MRTLMCHAFAWPAGVYLGRVARSRRLLRSRLACAPPEDGALEQRVAHHPVPSVRAACDLAARVETLESRLGLLVDDEAAVLVVEDGIGQDRLGEGVDAAGTVPAQHVRKGHVRVVLGDAGRVEVDRGPS